MTAPAYRRPMFAASVAACIAAALLLAGCAGSGPLACQSNQRYANSRTIGPWRIPDDLSAPREADALQIPAVPGQNGPSASTAGSGTPCLESPPTFHEQDDQAPQSRAATPSRDSAGEAPRRGFGRRGERRAGRKD